MVNTTADSGVGSLRAEVNMANNGDTINFAATLGGQTITLTTGQITLNTSITIDGQTNNVTISGGGSSRIFYNPTASLTETINNLIFEKGQAVSDGAPDYGRGGAIYDLGTLTLTNDTFYDNNASGNGGAVYTGGGTLTVNNGMFNENQATSLSSNGGALYVDTVAGSPGNASLTDVAFTSNTADGSGGAVYAVPSATTATQLTVSSCDFTGNQATGGAGGAISTGDQLTVTAGSFTGNTSSVFGGAIAYIFTEFPATTSGSMTLSNITFKNNTAEDYNGGAVASYVTAAHSTVAVSVMGCLFTGNKAPQGKGGGLYVSHTTSGTGAASLTVTNDTFYQGYAQYGGGIALDNSASNGTTNTVTLTSLTVYQNEATTNGGGLWISAATGVPGLRPQLTNNIIAGNYIDDPPTDGPDVSGNALSLGFNLIGETDGSGNTVWLSNDIKGTSTNPKSPGLAPGGPTDNGGLTFTIKLVSGSLAYENGNPVLGKGPGKQNTTDQRGYIRQLAVSIGAYDPDATAPPP